MTDLGGPMPHPRPPDHHAVALREARERELAILEELTGGNPLENDREAA